MDGTKGFSRKFSSDFTKSAAPHYAAYARGSSTSERFPAGHKHEYKTVSKKEVDTDLSCVVWKTLGERAAADLPLQDVLLVEEEDHARVFQEPVVADGPEQTDGVLHPVLLRVLQHHLRVHRRHISGK